MTLLGFEPNNYSNNLQMFRIWKNLSMYNEEKNTYKK